jgi:chemotaxis protein methyltransferase CheR
MPTPAPIAAPPASLSPAPALSAARREEPVAAPRPPAEPQRADVDALVQRARRCADDGRLAEAAEYCAAAIAADKLNPEWTDLHASILLEQGAIAAAEKALKRTLYLDQNRVLTHVKLANLLWGEARRRAEGRRHFRTALELLEEHDEQDALADTDGMTVAQLRTLIQTAIAHDVAGTYGTSA